MTQRFVILASLLIAAWSLQTAAAQIVIREHIEIVQTASVTTTTCDGPVVAHAVFRALGSGGFYSGFTIGETLDAEVEVETLCGSWRAPLAPAYSLTSSQPYTYNPNLLWHLYDADPDVEILRVPLRSLDGLQTVTVFAADTSNVYTHDPASTQSTVDYLGFVDFGCKLWNCGDDDVGAKLYTGFDVENVAASATAEWPSAVTCGTETPLDVRMASAGGLEGHLHAGAPFNARLSRVGPWVPSIGSLVSGDDQGATLTTTHGALRDGSVVYRAPDCVLVGQSQQVELSARNVRSYSMADLNAIRRVTIIPVRQSLDLVADSDHDGALTEADEAAEFSDARVGALVAFNDNDDNENDESDLVEAGFADPDLVPLRIEGPVRDLATVHLDTLSGGAAVRLWRDAAKRDSLPLPATLPASELPITLYAEGAAWDEAPAVLRAHYQIGPVQTPVAVASDTLRIHSGTPDLWVPEAILPGRTWPGSLVGLPGGTPAEIVIKKGRTEVFRTPVVAESADAFAYAEAGSVPGDAYRVEAWGDAPAGGPPRLLAEADVEVVAGAPATVTLRRDDTKPLVADGRTQIALVAEVRDADGFLVPGVDVQLRSAEWLGEEVGPFSSAPARTTAANGTAQFNVRAPDAGDAAFVAVADTAQSDELALDYRTPTLSLSASKTSTDVSASTTAGKVRITATTDAPYGTRVEWTVSHVAPGRRSDYTSYVQSNGTARLDVVARNAPLGTAHVSARVGEAWDVATVRFETSAPLSMELDQRLFAGDLVGPAWGSGSNGFVSHTYETRYQPVDSTGQRLPETTFYQGTVLMAAATPIKVRGAPNTNYTLSLDDADDVPFVAFENGPVSYVSTDSTGHATAWVRSTGAMGPDDPVRRVSFSVFETFPDPDGLQASVPEGAALAAGASAGDSWTETIYLAPANAFANTLDFMRGGIGGDPQTAWGVAGAFAGGMIGVADAGALAKNAWRKFTGGKVNRLEVVLSALGLATELAVGAGEAADAPISAVRAIVSFAGNGAFSKTLVWMLKTGMRNGRDLKNMGRFALQMVRKPGFLQAAPRAFTSRAAMQQAVNASENVEGYAEAVHRVVTQGVRCAGSAAVRAPSAGDIPMLSAEGRGPSASRGPPVSALTAAPCEISLRAIKDVTKLLGTDLPVRLAAKLDALDGPAQAAYVARLQRISHAGQLSTRVLHRLFDNDIFFDPQRPAGILLSSKSYPTQFTIDDLMDDLETVADAIDLNSAEAVKGFFDLVNNMGNTGLGRLGFRYELEAAAWLVRNIGGSPLIVTRKVFRRNKKGHLRLLTDIDVVLNGVYYQVKWSKSAFSGRGGIEESMRRWIRRARHGRPNQTIAYVAPPGQFPDTALEFLRREGHIIREATFR